MTAFEVDHRLSDDPGLDDAWGRAREKARRRRTRLVYVMIALLSGLAAIVLQIAADGNGVFDHRSGGVADAVPPWLRIVGGIALTVALLFVAALNWRWADEIRRAEIASFWAAIGFTMLTMFPVLHVIGPYVSPETRLALVYAVGLGGGIVWYVRDRGASWVWLNRRGEDR